MKTRYILFIFITLTLLACSAETQQPIKDYKATWQDITQLNQDIQDLISDKSCQQDADCELIALGARACGGPESYEVYARKNTDVKQLTQMAEQLKKLNETYNLENQLMSICLQEPQPAIKCHQQICRAQANSTSIQ